MVELQRLDMGERPGVGETGNFRHCRVSPDVEHDLIAGKKAHTALSAAENDGVEGLWLTHQESEAVTLVSCIRLSVRFLRLL
jgi:hypothetical protein